MVVIGAVHLNLLTSFEKEKNMDFVKFYPLFMDFPDVFIRSLPGFISLK